MDVTLNRNINKVVVLGSGISILDLTQEEIAFINQCKTVIAINKYMAFYKKIGILPTHVFFCDMHENSLNFLQYILKICIQDGLEKLTIINNRKMKWYTYRIHCYAPFALFKAILIRLRRAAGGLIKKKSVKALKAVFGKYTLMYIPRNYSIHYVKIGSFIEGGNWSDKLGTRLFHFRGSLTSALNYISIVKPGTEIFLVGNDFNKGDYFFESELNQLEFKWKDYTHDLVKKEKMHFSFQNFEGRKMTDMFPFVIDSLQKTGNNLYCTNEQSLLVTEAGVQYRKLL